MEVHEQEYDDAMPSESVILRVSGKLDFEAEDVISECIAELIQSGRRSVIFNLEAVDYASSGGLGIMLQSAKQLQQSGGQLVICSPQSIVSDILRLTRLDTIIPVSKTLEEAVAAIQPSKPA